jgi:chromosome segregation ATPase
MTRCKNKVGEATRPRIAAVLVALVTVAVAAPAGAQLQEALTAQVAADRVAQGSQKTIDTLRERTQDAAGRYAQALADAESLERYNKQLQDQVDSQQTEIGSIERQLLDIETTNREVQPLMEQMVEALTKFVQLDVPFLLDERTQRVQGLKSMMARADVTISEKYRRILEAYQIELEYGRTMDSYEGRLGTEADARTVQFVRLGRVTLLYRTLDGSETGYWDAINHKWQPDDRYSDAIETAIKVIGGSAPELLTVPVQAPQEVRS